MFLHDIVNPLTVAEAWSAKYKRSINCSHPRGFSQKAHCAGKKKHNESHEVMEMTCPDCGMCQTHGTLNEIRKGQKDSNGFTKCWPGKHAEGTKKGKNGGQVRNCVPNKSVEESEVDEVFGFQTTKPAVKKPTASLAQMRKEFEKETPAPQPKIVQSKDADEKRAQAVHVRHADEAAKNSHGHTRKQQAAIAMAKQGVAEGSLNEFSPGQGGNGDDGMGYLHALAQAWYTHDLSHLADIARKGGSPTKKIIDAQEAVEKILNRGVHCPDGKVRKYYIDYTANFDGVDMVSHDYYEHSDYGPNDEYVDGRTGKPWSVYDHIEFSDDQLGEGVAEGQRWPDDRNSLSKNDRDIELMNPKDADINWKDRKIATKIKPSITKTTVDRFDRDTTVPNFLKKGVAEEVDTGQYDARKSNAKGATTPEQEKEFRKKVQAYGKELEQRQKEKAKGVAEGSLNEFAPGDGGEEDTLLKYARMWYNGDLPTQQQIEKILARSGWEIGEIEDEEGGAFVVQAGDINGNSYIGFSPTDLTEDDWTRGGDSTTFGDGSGNAWTGGSAGGSGPMTNLMGETTGRPYIRKVEHERADGTIETTYELLDGNGRTVKTGMSKETAMSVLKHYRANYVRENIEQQRLAAMRRAGYFD